MKKRLIPSLGLLFINKLQSFLSLDYIDRTGLASEADTVTFLCNEEHLRTESRADKLPVGRIGDGLEHLCNGGTILSVKVGVDLVEEVERGWITGLNSEDECEGAETYAITLC